MPISKDPADYSYVPPERRRRKSAVAVVTSVRALGALCWLFLSLKWATADDPFPTPFLAWTLVALWVATGGFAAISGARSFRRSTAGKPKPG